MTAPSLLLLSLFFVTSAGGALLEPERLAEYRARNYSWPVQHYVPDTPGWKKLYDHRFRQVAEIDDTDVRYEGYVQAINAALVAPNFTEFGFGMARAPDDLMQALRAGIRKGLEDGPRLEGKVNVINGDIPWFIDRPDLTQRVLEELQYYPETWAGLELTPNNAYGFRLYRNNSQLLMHVDKSQTHVISFILHIDSSEDSEPWPILIEDYHGNTHEVILTSGDILFYESSKCFHGRPHRFKGSWYSSVFVHYYPKYGWAEIDHDIEKHYAVPAEWAIVPTHHFETPLTMVGTALREPTCVNEWCQSEHTIKWSGPGEDGYWIAPTGEKFPFDPRPQKCVDLRSECELWSTWESNECVKNSVYMLKNCKKTCGACTPHGDSKDEL